MTTKPPRNHPLPQETQFTLPATDIEASPQQEANVQPAEPTSTPLKAVRVPRALAPDLLRALIVVLQALDHSALLTGAWRHGTAILSEEDGQIVTEWNSKTAWVARMLTHLCAPGFMFLLGMGIVYFGRSRSKLGWSTWRFVKHFLIRSAVLVVLNELLGVIATQGKVLVLNIVLLALAVNYILVGLLWLAVNFTENALRNILISFDQVEREHVGEQQPLLHDTSALNDSERWRHQSAASLAFHVHNLGLLCLTIVTIFWNIWLSPSGGHCTASTDNLSLRILDSNFTIRDTVSTFEAQPLTLHHFLFHDVNGWNNRFISPFPPLAWISFALLGVLYGRLIIQYSNLSAVAVSGLNALAGTVLAIFFVGTRLLHIGNLSEGCLRMPENLAHPNRNQYLVSFRAFFYVLKYPPSPAFFCYSMAINFLLLSVFAVLPVNTTPDIRHIKQLRGGTRGIFAGLTQVLYTILLPFGQSALFFYALHLPLYAVLSTLAKMTWAHPLGWNDERTGKPAVGLGNSPVFWMTYLLGLVILWVSCRWYARFKSSRGPESVFRFF